MIITKWGMNHATQNYTPFQNWRTRVNMKCCTYQSDVFSSWFAISMQLIKSVYYMQLNSTVCPWIVVPSTILSFPVDLLYKKWCILTFENKWNGPGTMCSPLEISTVGLDRLNDIIDRQYLTGSIWSPIRSKFGRNRTIWWQYLKSDQVEIW
jgi:hypothetical protein